MSVQLPFLELRGIRKGYPGVQAIEHADMTVGEGEIVGLVGKNGAGKSTLLKVLAGAVRPDAGQIDVDGVAVQIDSARDAHRLRFAFVHQELLDVPELSVAENVVLAHGFPRRGPGLVRWGALNASVSAVLAELSIDVDVTARVRDLPIAQRRMVMLASALYGDARLIVLDEPTASLSAPEVQLLHAAMEALKRKGVSIVYVSHRLEEVFATCDRVVVMRDGSTVSSHAVQTLNPDTLLREITGHREAPALEHQRVTAAPDASAEELLSAVGLRCRGSLHDVNLSLRRGEVLGIAGLVGAGRTELVRLLVGADPGGRGEIRVKGERVVIRSPADALDHGLALLPEDRRNQGLVASFGIRANTTLPTLRRFRRLQSAPFVSRVKEATATRAMMQQLNIRTTDEEKPVRELSGGNQQKVMLARWVLHGTDVLIFDEPTHGIDVPAKEELFALVSSLAQRGKGVIFISSDLRELERVCTRVLVLREGRPVTVLDGEEITEEHILAGCYGR
jgi:ABC-type sugar transport system ATPase subunit